MEIQKIKRIKLLQIIDSFKASRILFVIVGLTFISMLSRIQLGSKKKVVYKHDINYSSLWQQ